MAQVIQPGFVQLSDPMDNFGNYIAQGAMRGAELGFEKARQDKANKFAAINSIISKTFPDERGGFTAAYQSGNPKAAAAADQALGLYLNSVEGITGKRLKADERDAIKGAFVNGQLTTKQLLENSRAITLSPGGQAQPQPQVQGPVGQLPQATAVGGPATPMVSTGSLGGSGGQRPPTNIETLVPRGQPIQAPSPRSQEPVGQPPLPDLPLNRTPDAARRMAEQATLQGQGYGSMAGSPGVTVPPLQAAEPAPPQAPQGGVTINTSADRAVRKKLFDQVLRVNESKRKGEEKNPFLVGEVVQFTPEETKAFQDAYSREVPEGGRAVPTGSGSEIALDNRELTQVAKVAKSTSTLMDTLMKARNADELGRKSYSVTRALETAAALVPGAKEMDREWAAGVVKALVNATPQELSALGLNQEAQVILDNDKNRIMAEQNSVNLFSTLKRAAVDLTQLETSKKIAELQYLGSASASTGTQQGILTKAMSDISVELIKAAAGSNPGKKLTGTDYAKFLNEAGFKDFADFTRGLYGGEGVVYQPKQGLPLIGTPAKFRPPTDEEKTEAGATPGATFGQVASGYLGGGAPTGGMQSSKTAQAAAAKASGIDQFFAGGGVQDVYKRNADQMYQDWQAFLASQQQ